MRRLYCILVCILVTAPCFAQQDAQFSQYLFNGLYINPAHAGYRQQWNVNAFYRNQWTGYPGAPQTFSLAADGSANDERVGLGVIAMEDKLGPGRYTSFYGNYAYRIPMDADGTRTLAIGIGAGFVQQHLDVSLLNPVTETDNLILNSRHNALLPDAKFGIFYNSDRFFAGASIDNLMTETFQKSTALKTYLPMKPHLYVHVGGLVALSESFLLKPSLLVKEDFAGPTSVDVGTFLLISKVLWIGAAYRTAVFNKSNIQDGLEKSAAVLGMAEFFIGNNIRIGYGYDATINATAAVGYTTHEISLGYFFGRPKAKMLSPRYF